MSGSAWLAQLGTAAFLRIHPVHPAGGPEHLSLALIVSLSLVEEQSSRAPSMEEELFHGGCSVAQF